MTFFDVSLETNDNLDYLLEKNEFNIKLKDNNYFIDLRKKLTPLNRYEFLGSTANCIASLIEYDIPNYKCSRMFIYYNERLNTENYNLNNSIKNLLKYGFCSSDDYEYDAKKINSEPSKEIYEKANEMRYKFEMMKLKKNLNSICSSLINNEPIIISIKIYDNFEINSSLINIPEISDKEQGGITIIICGFNISKQVFIIQLLNRYYEIPFLYILSSNYSSIPYIFMMRTFINFNKELLEEKEEKLEDVEKIENNYINLKSKFPNVYDQGKIGSCTAIALCSIYEYDTTNFIGSKLFLYYNERLLINQTENDSGAYIKDGIECLKTYGICEEKYWKYTIDNLFKEPSKEAYNNAKNNYLIEGINIPNELEIIKYWLNKNEPIALSIAIYSNFMNFSSARTGKIGIPRENDKFIGGHAIVLCGYDENKKEFILRNSWGIYWGDNGYFYLPYDYITNKDLCNDLWIIRKISRRL